MRKGIAILALAVSAFGFSTGSANTRVCEDHDGWTAATGFKIGTTQDQGRDSVDVCSDDGIGWDGVARAGITTYEGGYVAVDGDNHEADGYVYLTTGPDARGVYCGLEGDYDRPGDRTDRCLALP